MVAALLASAAIALPGGPVGDAQRIAERTFPVDCPVQIEVRRLPGMVIGHAFRQGDYCRITLHPAARWSWRILCTTVVHEYGHLAGREHSRNRRSVMYPVVVRTFWRCKRGRR